MKRGLFFLLLMVAFVFKGFSQSTPADSTEMYAYIDSVLAEARGPIKRTDFFNLLTTFNSYMAVQGVNGTGLLSAGDTASMLSSYTRYVEFLDSISDLRADLGSGALQLTDTAAMLQSYIQRSDTAAAFIPFIERSDTAVMLSSYPKNSDLSYIDLSINGAVYGNVSKSVQQSNWTILKNALLNDKSIFISDILEVYVETNDYANIVNDVLINGLGDSISKISIYPKFKGIELGDRVIFQHNGNNINFNQLTVDGYSDRWSYETYSMTIRPSGDTNAIRIDDVVRTGFWTDLTIGDSLYIQETSTIPGYAVAVFSFDSTTAIIQTSKNFTTANNYKIIDSTLVGRSWSNNPTQNEINTYSKQWNTINKEKLILFSSSIQALESSIVISNSNIKGVDYGFDFSQSNTHLILNNINLQANAIGINWTGASINQFARLTINGGKIYDCATLSEASTNSNGLIFNNSRFGGGVYLHPGIIPTVENVYFVGNNSTAFRNYSSSGNIIYKAGWRGLFSGCTWFSSNVEPLLICSSAFPTFIDACNFYSTSDGGITRLILGNSTFISNSIIDVPVQTDSNSEPENNDTSRYQINISNSILYENSTFTLNGWPNTMDKVFVSFEDVVWYLGTRSSEFTVKVSGADLVMRDVLLTNRKSSIVTFNDFIQVVEDTAYSGIKIDLYNVDSDSTFTNSTFITATSDLSANSNYLVRVLDCDVSSFPTFEDGNITVEQRFIDNIGHYDTIKPNYNTAPYIANLAAGTLSNATAGYINIDDDLVLLPGERIYGNSSGSGSFILYNGSVWQFYVGNALLSNANATAWSFFDNIAIDNGKKFLFNSSNGTHYLTSTGAEVQFYHSNNLVFSYNSTGGLVDNNDNAYLTTKSSGWAHYIDTAYATAADSFYVAQGSTLTLPIKADMTAALVTNYLPNGVDSLFSQHDSTILGIETGASYTVRINFKAKNSSNTGYATLALDIGTGGTPNIATAESLVFPKGAGVETQESKTVLLYSLDTFVANGCKIKITADTGNLEIYDIRLLVRLDSRP